MRTYITKKLIDGYKIDKVFTGTMMVAVPEHTFKQGDVRVRIKGAHKAMVLYQEQPPLCKKQFMDQYGRGLYTLRYYEWKPQEEQLLII